MPSIVKWFRAVLHRHEYKRWLKEEYLAWQRHATVYKFRETYQFVAGHQNENGYLCEDSKAVILPDSIGEMEFVQNLRIALKHSGAVDSQRVKYDRSKFLKAHRAKSYKDFYGHSTALSVSYDEYNQTVSVLSWRPAPGRGQVPVEGSKQIFDAHSEASWLQIKSILDGCATPS